uniref:hypothetical protein n=1 Tax=Streptomyces sp. NRRL S-813 TaxID=1463919 RepID=UPI00055A3413
VAFLAEPQHPGCRSRQQLPPTAGVVVLAARELGFVTLVFALRASVAEAGVGEGFDGVRVVGPESTYLGVGWV